MFFSYKHAIDGMIRITREEGVMGMFNGATMATVRAVVMTVGQLSVYDQVKQGLLYTELFDDNPNLHFTASIITVHAVYFTINIFIVKIFRAVLQHS